MSEARRKLPRFVRQPASPNRVAQVPIIMGRAVLPGLQAAGTHLASSYQRSARPGGHMWQSQFDENQDEPNEAWRGDVHLDDDSWLGGQDAEAWRGDADAESWQDAPDAEKRRGGEHPPDLARGPAGARDWQVQ